MSTLTLTLDAATGKRLTSMAKKKRRQPDECAAELLRQLLEDLEDERIVLQRLKNPGRRIPLHEVVKTLGL